MDRPSKVAQSNGTTCSAKQENGGGWQQRKSQFMREMILDAAIDCLVEDGYAGLSLREVLRRSRVSRGAAHHHFNNKFDLVAALVEYVLSRRLKLFLEEYFSRIVREASRDALRKSAELYGRTLKTREFLAYLELWIAARTDDKLKSVFMPAARKFDEVWMGEMVKAFPQWTGRVQKMKLAADFVQSAYLGLHLNAELFGEERERAVSDLINSLVVVMYEKEIE